VCVAQITNTHDPVSLKIDAFVRMLPCCIFCDWENNRNTIMVLCEPDVHFFETWFTGKRFVFELMDVSPPPPLIRSGLVGLIYLKPNSVNKTKSILSMYGFAMRTL
jgi:hypothetical protein